MFGWFSVVAIRFPGPPKKKKVNQQIVLAKIGFDTAENVPVQKCTLILTRFGCED